MVEPSKDKSLRGLIFPSEHVPSAEALLWQTSRFKCSPDCPNCKNRMYGYDAGRASRDVDAEVAALKAVTDRDAEIARLKAECEDRKQQQVALTNELLEATHFRLGIKQPSRLLRRSRKRHGANMTTSASANSVLNFARLMPWIRIPRRQKRKQGRN